MKLGPVQIVVLAFPEQDQIPGSVLEELDRLQGNGVLRVLDLLAIHKDHSGDLLASQHRDEDGDLGAIVGALLGFGFSGSAGNGNGNGNGDSRPAPPSISLEELDLEQVAGALTPDELRHVTDALEPGTSAAVLVIQHCWARELRSTVRGSGGFPLAQAFLTPEAILLVGAELAAMVEAMDHIEHVTATQVHTMVERKRGSDRLLGTLKALDVLVSDGVLDIGTTPSAIASLHRAGLLEEREAEQLSGLVQA